MDEGTKIPRAKSVGFASLSYLANLLYSKSLYIIWARFIAEGGNGRPKLVIEKRNLLYTLVNTNESVSDTGAHVDIIARLLTMQSV